MPSATMATTVATGIRSPLMQGCPPICSGRRVIRSYRMANPSLPYRRPIWTLRCSGGVGHENDGDLQVRSRWGHKKNVISLAWRRDRVTYPGMGSEGAQSRREGRMNQFMEPDELLVRY